MWLERKGVERTKDRHLSVTRQQRGNFQSFGNCSSEGGRKNKQKNNQKRKIR